MSMYARRALWAWAEWRINDAPSGILSDPEQWLLDVASDDARQAQADGLVDDALDPKPGEGE